MCINVLLMPRSQLRSPVSIKRLTEQQNSCKTRTWVFHCFHFTPKLIRCWKDVFLSFQQSVIGNLTSFIRDWLISKRHYTSSSSFSSSIRPDSSNYQYSTLSWEPCLLTCSHTANTACCLHFMTCNFKSSSTNTSSHKTCCYHLHATTLSCLFIYLFFGLLPGSTLSCLGPFHNPRKVFRQVLLLLRTLVCGTLRRRKK